MALEFRYDPVGAIGQMATLAGQGEFKKYRDQQALREREFAQRQAEFAAENALANRRQGFQERQSAEDNRFRAINAFNEAQQDAFNNNLRGQQQAEGMARARAEFGMDQRRMALGERQQYDQNAFKWYDRMTDAYFQAAGMQQRGEENEMNRQLQRDLLTGRQEGYDRRNEFMQGMQDQRLGAQRELLELKFNLQEQQDLNRIDQGIYRIRQGVQAGGLVAPDAMRQISQLEGQRSQIMTGARERMESGVDPRQRLGPQQVVQERQYIAADGTEYTINRYGEPQIIRDVQKEADATVRDIMNRPREVEETITDEKGNKAGTGKMIKRPPTREEVLEDIETLRRGKELLTGHTSKAEIAPAPRDVTNAGHWEYALDANQEWQRTWVRDDGRGDDNQKGTIPRNDKSKIEHAVYRGPFPIPNKMEHIGVHRDDGGPNMIIQTDPPIPVRREFDDGVPKPVGGGASGKPAELPARELRQAAFQELGRTREKLSKFPEMQRSIDWLESIMSQYPSLADAPPKIRNRARALLDMLDRI